eukprot:CAMPEP_0202837594 /NCGR_PEP_ID=MMETSP1389-20130828/46436_1 /ASSEMBLY_ACC=CAM_ASM_000865 /TAXON_ID=302021 /ORGANISM="Rhodomonas sp., Strain CCMP768" /LENGTH=32 /DNA_ID= /DNA_START= /DNA_END= /DNA_ORIENTATION=
MMRLSVVAHSRVKHRLHSLQTNVDPRLPSTRK